MRFKDQPQEHPPVTYQLACSRCKSTGIQLFSTKAFGKQMLKLKRITKEQLKSLSGYYCKFCLKELERERMTHNQPM